MFAALSVSLEVGGGSYLVVRFRFPHAHSVSITGDWNAWQTTPLRPVGDGV